MQHGFKAESPTFFKRDAVVSNSKRRVCGLEKIPVDLMLMIEDYLLKSRDLEALQAANGEFFDFFKFPLLCELEN